VPAQAPVQARHALVRTRAGVMAVRGLVEGEVMHPGVGPRIEAERLYVGQSRLAERLAAPGASSVVVFDVGLGAGSNAAAAFTVAEQSAAGAARLELVSFERDLGAFELGLAHAEELGLVGCAAAAGPVLLAEGRVSTSRSTWRLERGDVLEALKREPARADVVFWDPFSPRANPALWTVAAFAAVRARAGGRCVLVTYSASTAVRIAMLLGGWVVGVGDPIGDKAATTVAATEPELLVRPLERSWLSRLARPDVPLPPDSPPDAAARIARLSQFGS
jgi:queuine tRNA-ribosyltransferase